MPNNLDLAYEHCERIARKRARNFYFAFRTLPRQKRRAIYAAYALCRLCDDIADEGLPIADQRRLLDKIRQALASSRDGGPEDPVFVALGDTTARFGIPDSYLEEIVTGVEADLTWVGCQTFEELRQYCYGVAAVVGLVCIEVFGYNDPAAKRYAVDLGLGMQLTNILRDLKEDAQRDRIYLPVEEMHRFGYSEQELVDGVRSRAFEELMRFQVARAREYLERGRRLVPLLSRDSRACPAVLRAIYSGVLDRIESANYDVFARRISLGTGEKLALMGKIWARHLLPPLPLVERR